MDTLARYFDSWCKITKDSFVLNIVKNGYKIQTLNSVLSIKNYVSNPSLSKRDSLNEEINSLLEPDFISKVEHYPDHTVSRVFLVPKKDGGNRLILDLSALNNHINKVSFKMEDKITISSLIESNDYFASIDLKSAFHIIPLHNDSKKLVVFEIFGQRYCFNFLPFGLTSAPRVFSKVLKPVINFIRNKGIKITFYLDDILIIGPSYDSVCNSLSLTLDILCNLGFKINYEKSSLVPNQVINHLGYLWNSKEMCISLPTEKIGKIKHFCLQISSECVSLRRISALLGMLVNSSNGFSYAPLHYRSLQLCFIEGLKCSKSWDDCIILNNNSLLDLKWWIHCKPDMLIPVPILPLKPDLILHTDASMSGWGSSLSNGEYISGQWCSGDRSKHINYLELKAILFSIDHFINILKNKSLLIKCDNTSAVFYINKKGGTNSEELCSLALKIWHLLYNNNISCIASHISGVKNVTADFLSRCSFFHEYSLSPSAFKYIQKILPFELKYDLFASKLNHKLKNYCAILDDSEALQINAFSLTWHSGSYLFPPIPLISKVISKFIRDKVGFGFLITPSWHSLTVLPLIEKMLIFNPIFIPPIHLLGCQPTRHQFPLMGWPISSNIVLKKEFLQTSQNHWSIVLTKRLSHHIQDYGNILLNGLLEKDMRPIFLSI